MDVHGLSQAHSFGRVPESHIPVHTYTRRVHVFSSRTHAHTSTCRHAQVQMEFLNEDLSFLNVTLCDVSFPATESAPHVVQGSAPLVFTLPAGVTSWGCA
jgi:hypothetical protein